MQCNQRLRWYGYDKEKNNQVKETPEDLSLNFRVRINIDDIWKNTKKLLPVKNKYTINLD